MARKSRSGDGEYDVGYRKPPREHQFKPGESGNDRGRPRAKKTGDDESSLKQSYAYIVADADSPVTVRENGRETQLTSYEAVFLSLRVTALKGNTKAQEAYLTRVDQARVVQLEERTKLFELARACKEGAVAEFEKCDQEGKPRPDIIPHPDEVILNWSTLDVYFNGPRDPYDKQMWEQAFEWKRWHLIEINELKKAFRRRHADKFQIEYDIACAQWIIDLVDRTYPHETIRRKSGFSLEEWRERMLRFHERTGRVKRPKAPSKPKSV